MRITVRPTGRNTTPPSFTGGSERLYAVEKAWRVYEDRGPTDTYVVQGPVALTMIHWDGGPDAEMVTTWHTGISAGDLARFKYERGTGR